MTTAEKLALAEAAYHKLITGTAARVIVDQNGERVEFAIANQARLLQYINDLKALLGTPVVVNSPFRTVF